MKRYDLNLLQALEALLQEKSVSKAARRLGVNQPAMSAALSRLRDMFGDPLLVRKGNGMAPTARALAITGPLSAGLAQLGALIEPPMFNPATVSRRLRISGGDYIGMTVLPRLAAKLASKAPGIDLRFRYLEKEQALASLDSNDLDLALMVNDVLPPRFGSEILLEERFAGAARPGHPLLDGPIDLRRFASFDHLLVTERGDETGHVDEVLAAAGLSRRVAITVPSAALVADILRGTDLIATIPFRAAQHLAASGSITLFDPPVDLGTWSKRMIWAARNNQDPATVWLREILRSVVEEI